MGDAAYQEVLDSLSSLISQKPKIADQDAYTAAYVNMQTYLEVLYRMLVVSYICLLCKHREAGASQATVRLGLQRLDMVKELTKLKVIHVAGTKGKVSLSARCSFMAMHLVFQTRKA